MKKLIPLLLSLAAHQGLAQQKLVLQQGAEIRRNGYSMNLVYEDLQHALLDQADPATNFGGPLAPPLLPLIPADSGEQTQVLLHFDNFVGPDLWQIPPGSVITGAQLILPFQSPGGAIRVSELLLPWDPHTVNWDNFGPGAGNGVSGPEEGFPFLETPLPLPPALLDVQPIVQAWVENPDANHGLMIELPTGPELILPGPNFEDPAQFNGGLPFHLPVGQLGMRSGPGQPFFQLTDPILMTEDPFISPALIIEFELPQNPGDPLGNAFFSPPQVLPPAPGDPLAMPQIIWEGPPGMSYKPLFSPDLGPDSWLCPPGINPIEELPGQYRVPFPAQINGAPAGRQFGKIVPVDKNGNGFFDNRAGGSNAKAAGEACPENGIAQLLKTVERTGTLLIGAENNLQRNALIAELRTIELLYKFAQIHYNRGYGSAFQEFIEALMEGEKKKLPQINTRKDMEMFKHAVEYLRFLVWWELTYNEKLTQQEKIQINTLHNELINLITKLCAFEPFKTDDLGKFEELCNEVLRKINDTLNHTEGRDQAPGAGGILLKKLFMKLVSEGANGLWERLLTNVIGKSFVDGTFKAVNRGISSVMSIVKAVQAHLSKGELEEARRMFHLALCALYDEASKLEKFTLIDDGVDNFQVIHSGKIHPKMKSTTVEPVAFTWVPSTEPGAKKGEGKWVEEKLTFDFTYDPKNPDRKPETSKTFSARSAEQDPGSSTRYHDFLVNMPDIEPGQKTYVVYKVTRRWCLPDGSEATQTDNYYRGVVKPRS